MNRGSMTNKKAGTILTTFRRQNKAWLSDDINKALDVAIKAIKTIEIKEEDAKWFGERNEWG